MKSSLLLSIMTIAIFSSMPVLAGIEDFGSLPAGTVVAGEMPGGGIAPGSIFSGFTLSVTNNGGGPSSLVIFDSANPTGGDSDLGTPNQAFGGPGIGSGGSSGPGVNAVSLNNLLICAENINDENDDELVDDPDDEAGGCIIEFNFDEVVDLESITFVDIDSESVDFEVTEEGLFIGGGAGGNLGDNSVQTLDLTSFTSVDHLIVEFSSSGAIAELEFHSSSVPTDKVGFGAVKALYRDSNR